MMAILFALSFATIASLLALSFDTIASLLLLSLLTMVVFDESALPERVSRSLWIWSSRR